MPTTTLAPDAILDSTGWFPNLADIDEDPDTPAGDWCDVAGLGTGSSSIRVSFPTPPGNPTGTQTFKAYLRKHRNDAPGNPNAQLSLYENGSLLAGGTPQSVTSTTGQLVSENFDLAATPLADPTGAQVELLLECNASIGSPSSGIDLDALNWDTVNYTAGVTGYWLVP